MKNFGLFLLKHNMHIMTLCFLGWAIWAALNWSNLELVQKIALALYAFLILHEYEESYKDRFLELMAGRLLKIDYKALTPGLTHLAQAIYITTIFSLAILFPQQLWLTFGVIILAIFEGYVHNMGIILFRLKGLTPGWWTAIGMAAFGIWGIVVIGRDRRNCVNYVKTVDNVSKGSVIAVKVRFCLVADEELRGSRVGRAAASHRDNSLLVNEVVFKAVT